jgi:ribosomal protein S18 acetylase RimI-like enzyme
MTIAVRPAVAGDEMRLAAVGQASFLEAFAGDLDGNDILAHCAANHSAALYAGWLADVRYRLFLAEAPGGAPVGYGVLAPPDLPLPDLGPHDVEIKRIYVLHRFHGQKVGWSLMNAMLTEGRGAGRRRALVGTLGTNARAIAFYGSFGFRLAGERQFRVGRTVCDDVIMALTL